MTRPRILIIGAGFAGLECARRLERGLSPAEARLTLLAPDRHQLYLPLLPHVAAGVLTPQSVCVPVHRVLRRTRTVPGGAIGIDPQAKVCVLRTITGEIRTEPYDYLVLAPGSVTRTFDVPGLSEHARGMKTLAEAAYLRDHVLAQVELAAAAQDPEERRARLCFVVVGGGYAGTETAACLQRLTAAAVGRHSHLRPDLAEWHLVDAAPRLMPELGDRLAAHALAVLRRRRVQVGLGVSVAAATAESVTLTDGRVLATRTLLWTAGVAASPLIATLGASTTRGRLDVTSQLQVPRHPEIFALGDAAAVPDLTSHSGALCPPTAQHAARQGRTAADNLIATLRKRPLRSYRHHDLGLVVDLGGRDAVAKPLGVPLTGLPAQLVARGYHLTAMRSAATRARAGANWLLNTAAGDDFIRTGFLTRSPARLRDFEYTDAYLTPTQVHEHVRSLRLSREPGISDPGA